MYLRGQGLISRAFSAWYRADHRPPEHRESRWRCHLRSFSPARRGKEDELDKGTEHPIRLSLLPNVTELVIGKDAIPLPVR